jgi:hypothetical protein
MEAVMLAESKEKLVDLNARVETLGRRL